MNAIEVSDRKRLIHSSLVSLGFWFAIAMIVILAPVTKTVVLEEKYPVVAINLIALPSGNAVVSESAVATAAPAAPAVAPAAAAATVKTVAPAAPAAAPKSAQVASVKAATKTSTAKTSQAAKKPQAAKAATAAKAAPAGLGIPNFSTPITSTTGTTDASESLDFTSTTESTHPATVSKPRGGKPTAELEGSAATVTKDTGSTAVSGSGTAKNPGSAKTGGTGAVSSETASTLAQIAGSAKSGTGSATGSGTGSIVGTSSGNVKGSGSSGAAGTGSSISGLSFEGTQRKLMYPSNPSIVLPESLRKLIDSDRTVTVSFSVKADGSVPGGLIVFTPTAIIPAEIRDYLRKEFSSWRFEKGSEDGQAKFLYSIKVE